MITSRSTCCFIGDLRFQFATNFAGIDRTHPSAWVTNLALLFDRSRTTTRQLTPTETESIHLHRTTTDPGLVSNSRTQSYSRSHLGLTDKNETPTIVVSRSPSASLQRTPSMTNSRTSSLDHIISTPPAITQEVETQHTSFPTSPNSEAPTLVPQQVNNSTDDPTPEPSLLVVDNITVRLSPIEPLRVATVLFVIPGALVRPTLVTKIAIPSRIATVASCLPFNDDDDEEEEWPSPSYFYLGAFPLQGGNESDSPHKKKLSRAAGALLTVTILAVITSCYKVT